MCRVLVHLAPYAALVSTSTHGSQSIAQGINSTKSDVWSMGILLWEIHTMGMSPFVAVLLAVMHADMCSYPGMSNVEVVALVQDKKTMAIPPHCPPEWCVACMQARLGLSQLIIIAGGS